MKSDKIEILLEGLTEDISTLKESIEGNTPPEYGKLLEAIKNDFLTTTQKITEVCQENKVLIEKIKLEGSKDLTDSYSNIIRSEIESYMKVNHNQKKTSWHLIEVVWPWQRLISSVLISTILGISIAYILDRFFEITLTINGL